MILIQLRDQVNNVIFILKFIVIIMKYKDTFGQVSVAQKIYI